MVRYIHVLGERSGTAALLGNKGLGLNEQLRDGLPVPPGFVITTDAYRKWKNDGQSISGLERGITQALHQLEVRSGRRFNADEHPLFVSVRSSGQASMPGMMDTWCNIGTTVRSLLALEREVDSGFRDSILEKFISTYFDSRASLTVQEFVKVQRQLPLLLQESLNEEARCKLEQFVASNSSLSSLADIIRKWHFDHTIAVLGQKIVQHYHCLLGGMRATDGTHEGMISHSCSGDYGVSWLPYYINYSTKNGISLLPEIIHQAKNYARGVRKVRIPAQLLSYYLKEHLGYTFPSPKEQVLKAISAVFNSWSNPRAHDYRVMKDIPDDLGTAVVVQAMIFGNRSNESGTAVVFTSDPKSGRRGCTGEYLLRAQGEALVSGSHTPQLLETLVDRLPTVAGRIAAIAETVEKRKGDIRDLEITWDGSRAEDVYLLQDRSAAKTPLASIAFALDRYLAKEMSLEEMVLNLNSDEVLTLVKTETVATEAQPLTTGSSLLQGIVSGRLVFNEDQIKRFRGERVVYCRSETSPKDINGIRQSSALLTSKGGAYSHAALVALGLRTISVVGCKGAEIYRSQLEVGGTVLKEGDYVTLDGHTGHVYKGIVPTVAQRDSPLLADIVALAKSTLGELPIYYSVQCLDDVIKLGDRFSSSSSSLSSSTHPSLMYSVDFDCLDASGLLTGKCRSRSEWKLFMEERAVAVSQRCLATSGGDVVFHYAADFNQLFNGEEKLLRELLRTYLRTVASAVRGSEVKDRVTFVNTPLLSEKRQHSFQTIPLFDHSSYDSGKNCVVVNPWEEEISYLCAAQARLRR